MGIRFPLGLPWLHLFKVYWPLCGSGFLGCSWLQWTMVMSPEQNVLVEGEWRRGFQHYMQKRRSYDKRANQKTWDFQEKEFLLKRVVWCGILLQCCRFSGDKPLLDSLGTVSRWKKQSRCESQPLGQGKHYVHLHNVIKSHLFNAALMIIYIL